MDECAALARGRSRPADEVAEGGVVAVAKSALAHPAVEKADGQSALRRRSGDKRSAAGLAPNQAFGLEFVERLAYGDSAYTVCASKPRLGLQRRPRWKLAAHDQALDNVFQLHVPRHKTSTIDLHRTLLTGTAPSGHGQLAPFILADTLAHVNPKRVQEPGISCYNSKTGQGDSPGHCPRQPRLRNGTARRIAETSRPRPRRDVSFGPPRGTSRATRS